jgi:hypothetical protein
MTINRVPFPLASLALSDEQIRQVAPSVFAASKYAERSERYTYIPTGEILAELRQEGFQPFKALQTHCRHADKRPFTKHLLRLRHVSHFAVGVGEDVNEIILINSHDGTSAYQMLAGVYRVVCSNGLVCSEVEIDIRIPHKGDVKGRVIEGAYSVLHQFEQINQHKAQMKSLLLSGEEQAALARAALALRYDTDSEPAPITEEQLLAHRRFEDRKPDLWTTFNRIQENLLKGRLARAFGDRQAHADTADSGYRQRCEIESGLVEIEP